MKATFWGVRGSLPAPLTPEQIQSKIAAVVQRISVEDLKSQDTRHNFLANLPSWITSTVGSNTSCVELENARNTTFILDAGSGIRLLGKKLSKQKKKCFHIFFSHFHWDHIHGLPFFDSLFSPSSELHFYSPKPYMKECLEGQMIPPYFPVDLSKMNQSNMHFHVLEDDQTLEIDGTTIAFKKMSHPSDSYAYSFEEHGKKLIYSTDVELSAKDITQAESDEFFRKANAIIFDAQYTAPEAIQKENWGHSSYSHAIDFAILSKIEQMYFFHHEPMYDDKKLYSILQSAKWYLEYLKIDSLKIDLAKEGQSIIL